jgi:TfoX/Sxy family transcriptional regulator of competence genes
MPKPSQAARDLFASVVPDATGVSTRPMFGQLAAFVNGNMFMGLYGDALFLRLPEEDRAEVLRGGGGPFEPVAGRPMREYVVVPDSWLDERSALEEAIGRSLVWAGGLPPPKKRRKA